MINDIEKPFGEYALSNCLNSVLSFAQTRPVNWLGRRLALFSRKLVLKSSNQAIIDAVVDGLKLRLYMRDNVSERKFLFMPQFFDTFERSLMKKELGAGSVFIDVGANAGIYTMTAASALGQGGKVLAIEPNPIVLDRLKFNTSLNNFEDKVIFEQAGVSDSAGSFDLVLDKSNLGGSSLVVERSSEKIKVNCDLLLNIINKHGFEKIDGLKIDIEGAEDKALIPFFKAADKKLFPKFIVLENSPNDWAEDLPAILKESGYKLLKITRMNQVWSL